MTNNIFYEKKTGEQVKILNEDNNFYVLDNSVRIKKDIFAKRYEQREEVDPNSFFKQPSNDPLLNIANQIKNLDTSRITDSAESGAQVKYIPPVVHQGEYPQCQIESIFDYCDSIYSSIAFIGLHSGGYALSTAISRINPDLEINCILKEEVYDFCIKKGSFIFPDVTYTKTK